ncbi:F-box only protein 15 isoform X2 [Pristis pectinata]|uniref:F-box only protein 15 isoform X2 n=1 Tax=Pristis pectinata TaxID=685728 RepID=UPI00223D30EC|nr:F-box only protein 15 isoform X2 [Pristis pectinata]
MATGGGGWAEVAQGCGRPRLLGPVASARVTARHGGCAALWTRRPEVGLACSSFGHKWAPSLSSRSCHGAKSGKLRSSSLTTIESLPWEVLLQIFTYLDVSSLLCAGCVNKSFYHVSNDKALGITWMIVLRERTGKEHVQEQSKACFSDTSATLCWNDAVWPPRSSLKALCVYGVTPLFPPSKTPTKHGPHRRSLLAEYDLTTLEESSTFIGGDKLIKLRCLYPGLLLGCWQEDGELAVIVANLHFHQLIEKSMLGSVTCPYRPPPHEPVPDDIVSEYGLLGYHCHIALHNGKSSYMSGSFHNLFCRKEYIQNGFLQIMVISLENESQHSTISGGIYIPWNTEFLKGKIQHCCLMDVTVLDEAEKPFWCVSSPVALQSISTPDTRYNYLGKRQTIDYKDPEGKVHVELTWLEEQQQYYIVNFVLYLSVRKVNAWFATDY